MATQLLREVVVLSLAKGHVPVLEHHWPRKVRQAANEQAVSQGMEGGRMKRDPWGIVLMILAHFCFWMSGFYFGVEAEKKDAAARGRCPHERMVNYDLHRAIATCKDLQICVDNAQDHLEKSVKFMDQVKEKLGE